MYTMYTANVGFHRECYMLFTNKEHIRRACNKIEKAAKKKACLQFVSNVSFLYKINTTMFRQ